MTKINFFFKDLNHYTYNKIQNSFTYDRTSTGQHSTSPGGLEWEGYDNNNQNSVSAYYQNMLQLRCNILTKAIDINDELKRKENEKEKEKEVEKEVEIGKGKEKERKMLSSNNLFPGKEILNFKESLSIKEKGKERATDKEREREKEKEKERDKELENDELHPKFCYNIEIEESFGISENDLRNGNGTGTGTGTGAGVFNSNVLSVAHAALSGRLFQPKEKQASYVPLRYTIVIHSPISIESLLPTGAVYEILHATTKRSLWRYVRPHLLRSCHEILYVSLLILLTH